MSNPATIETFDFDSNEIIEIPVKYKGLAYTLREADGDAACQYRNAAMRAMRYSEDGKPVGFTNLADVEPLLVSLCLYDAAGNRVTRDFARALPSKILKQLFAKAKEISEIDETDDLPGLLKQRAELDKKIAKLQEGKSAAKNEQSGTEDGSD
jgi:hypothetical protein